MTKVKICGIRSAENALMAARAGADLIGLNFYPKTPRCVDVAQAADIVAVLRASLGDKCPAIVGVFVNAPVAEIRQTARAADLDFVQLSGDESADTLSALHGIAFKAIRPATSQEALKSAEAFASSFPSALAAPSLLLDAYHPRLYGGTGETASIEVALAVKDRAPRLMLAGGLNPGNVAERVRSIKPWAVDVASGVEAGSPGHKDETKTRAFIAAVRRALP